jgi:NifU-like protein
MNRLTSPESVTHYTKAAGGCSTCVEGVESVLKRVNAAMVTEGLLSESEAYDPSVVARVQRVKKPKPEAAKPGAARKLTSLQRIRLIEQSIEELRPYFKRDGGDCELVDVEDDAVYVRFSGACLGCQMEGQTLQGVRERLMEKLGQVVRVVPVHA